MDKSKFVIFRLSPEEKIILTNNAKAADLNVSEYIRVKTTAVTETEIKSTDADDE